MKFFNLTLPLVAAMMSITSACSVSEPDIDAGPTGDNLRLTSISILTKNYVTINYDAQGRVTRLTRGYDEMTVSYSPLEIKLTERYDYYDDEADVTYWKDITLNSKGYISNATVVEEEDVSVYRFEYDNAGHLVRAIDDSNYTIGYSWDSSGRMTRAYDEEQTVLIEYYSTPNQHLQWDPNVPLYTGLVEYTGLLGVAPSYFVKSLTTIEDNYVSSKLFYNYRLNDNGWVIQSRVSDDDGDGLPYMNWNYSKK